MGVSQQTEQSHSHDDKKRLQDELEAKIRARTEELAQANDLLRQEVGHRRRAEEANAKFAAIVEFSSDAIIGHKLDGTIVTWNKGAERIFGYTEDEARGRSISILTPPDRADDTLQFTQAIRRGENVQHIETERVRKDGSRIDVSLTISPIKDAAGRVVGASRIARDITQRKRMEHALRDSEARARAILDTAVDAIITIDERGIMESFNPAAERLFGYLAAEVIGENVKMLMPEPYHSEHDEYLYNYMSTGIRKIIGIGREVIAKRKDGTNFHVDLAVSEVNLGNRRLFTGLIRDLTERKRLEQEILAISDREKQRIGQDLHDSLGQLLTGIGFKSKSLENKLSARGVPEADGAKRIADLVTQATSQARALARGLQPVGSEATGLMTALRELCLNLSDLFPIQCSFDCPNPVLLDNPAAATHLYRIAQEAAHNAIKHGKAKGIRISLMAIDRRIVLTISDDGAGFPSTPSPSKGMGMQIMRYRAAMIGGTLAVQPGAAGGTVVVCSVLTSAQE